MPVYFDVQKQFKMIEQVSLIRADENVIGSVTDSHRINLFYKVPFILPMDESKVWILIYDIRLSSLRHAALLSSVQVKQPCLKKNGEEKYCNVR